MKKSLFPRALCAVLAGGLVLTACGGGASESQSSDTPADTAAAGGSDAPAAGSDLSAAIKILAPSYAESSKSDWEAVIAGYNELYPDVEVTLQIEAWDGFTEKVQAAIQGGDAPDILNDNNFADFVKDDLLYPISEVMSAETVATVVPSLLANGVGTDGTQWAVPDIASARTLVYNKDLFDKAGVSAPPKTWDELLAAAQKIQALGDGIYGYGLPMGKEEAQVEASLWVWGAGGDWTDDAGAITANLPANVTAFDEIKTFIDSNAVQPNAGATNRQAVADLFDQGKLGMYVTHPGLMANTSAKFPDISWELAPVPSQDGSTAVSLGVTDFIVAFNNGDEARKSATKAFLDYLYTPEVYQKWAAGTGLLPVTEGAIEIQSAATPQNKPFYDALPDVRFLPQGNPKWSALQSALQANGGQIQTLSGQDTLDAVQAQVDATG